MIQKRFEISAHAGVIATSLTKTMMRNKACEAQVWQSSCAAQANDIDTQRYNLPGGTSMHEKTDPKEQEGYQGIHNGHKLRTD